MLAARHAGAVVATDVSERALAFAEFNCALNDADNVELRLGSFLEPAAGERFGLVVSNPPFAISPEHDLVFRDGGLGRDRVSEELALSLPSVLEPDGFGSMTAAWIVEGDDSAARPREWLERAGCDGWVLYEEPVDALASAVCGRAARTTRRSTGGSTTSHASGSSASLRGARAPAQAPSEGWTRSRRLPDEPAPPGRTSNGSSPESEPPTGELAAAPLMLAPDVDIEQLIRRSPDGWQLAHAALKLTGGLQFETSVDESVLELVRSLDGRPLASVLATMPEDERRQGECGRPEATRARLPRARRIDEGAAFAAPLGSSPSRGAGRGCGHGRRRGGAAPPREAAAGRSSPARSAPPARPAVRPRACGRA